MPSAIPFDLVVFLLGAFLAAFVTGLSGFAFGLVAAAVWLQALAPAQTTALIVGCALLVQWHAVWKLRRAIVLRRILPFVLGSAAGVPLGVLLLGQLPAAQLKLAVACLLVLFSLYNLLRPRMPSVAWVGRPGDAAVGVLNGLLGGATGLAGILPVVWSSMRGWSRDEQRAVFQPTAVATFAMCLAALGGVGIVTAETARLFVLGLPCLVLGTLAGWRLYGRLDDAAFRRVVLWLLLASGLLLAVTSL